jgi:hypothetical protein
MKVRGFLLSFVVLLAARNSSAFGAELEAYAGAVAGVAHGTGGPFACATSGATIPEWSAGVDLPTEGFAACSLAGGIDDKIQATPVAALQNINAPVPSGTFSGSAGARADYGLLGVYANGSMTGAGGGFAETAGFARFKDELTLSSPSVPAGTAGLVTFSFVVHGTMTNAPNLPYGQTLNTTLAVRVGGPSGLIWPTFIADVYSNTDPYVRGGATGVPGTLVVAPLNVSGSTELTTTASFSFTWGSPFTVEAVLHALAPACCFGASLSSDFYNVTRLSGIHPSLTTGPEITDFTVTAGSGTHYTKDGVAVVVVPVPAMPRGLAWVAAALLLGAGLWRLRLRARVA